MPPPDRTFAPLAAVSSRLRTAWAPIRKIGTDATSKPGPEPVLVSNALGRNKYKPGFKRKRGGKIFKTLHGPSTLPDPDCFETVDRIIKAYKLEPPSPFTKQNLWDLAKWRSLPQSSAITSTDADGHEWTKYRSKVLQMVVELNSNPFLKDSHLPPGFSSRTVEVIKEAKRMMIECRQDLGLPPHSNHKSDEVLRLLDHRLFQAQQNSPHHAWIDTTRTRQSELLWRPPSAGPEVPQNPEHVAQREAEHPRRQSGLLWRRPLAGPEVPQNPEHVAQTGAEQARRGAIAAVLEARREEKERRAADPALAAMDDRIIYAMKRERQLLDDANKARRHKQRGTLAAVEQALKEGAIWKQALPEKAKRINDRTAPNRTHQGDNGYCNNDTRAAKERVEAAAKARKVPWWEWIVRGQGRQVMK